MLYILYRLFHTLLYGNSTLDNFFGLSYMGAKISVQCEAPIYAFTHAYLSIARNPSLGYLGEPVVPQVAIITGRKSLPGGSSEMY